MSSPVPAARRAPSELAVRVASGVVLAGAVLAVTWWNDRLGGWAMPAVWTLAAVMVWAEWRRLIGVREPVGLAAGAAGLIAAVAAVWLGSPGVALIFVLVGMALAVLPAAGRAGPVAGGVAYAALAVLPVVLLRHDAGWGVVAVLYLYAVVWGSDTLAYAAGRTFGGPKLWPRLSPKKTWSGLIGGTLGGGLLACLVAALAGLGQLPVLFGLGALAAIASQGGDLFESALKRRSGVKDSGTLIPGHGGAMDRLDGFIAAGSVLAAVGLLRDVAHPAAGLLVW